VRWQEYGRFYLLFIALFTQFSLAMVGSEAEKEKWFHRPTELLTCLIAIVLTTKASSKFGVNLLLTRTRWVLCSLNHDEVNCVLHLLHEQNSLHPQILQLRMRCERLLLLNLGNHLQSMIG